MNTKKFFAAALVGLGLALAAQAQVTVGLSDLVLGFNKSSGTGSTSNVEVALGSVNNFKAGGTYATGSEVTLSQLSAADLNATFGTGTGSSGWKSTGTSWAVVGTNGAGGGNTLWSTQVTPENPGSSQGAGANTIATMVNGLNGKTSTANSSSAAVVPTANADSWKTTSSGNFSYFSSTVFRNTSALATVGGVTSLNLFEYVEGAASYVQLGTFKLYDTGAFTFTSFAAIPEPSTYAALLGVATLGVVAIRRRRLAAQEA